MTYGGLIGVYDNTKAALIHLTGHLAAELGPKVRVNAICAGTGQDRLRPGPVGGRRREEWPSVGRWRRLGEPEDIANAALFLASDLASWITGDVLVIDGGALIANAV